MATDAGATSRLALPTFDRQSPATNAVRSALRTRPAGFEAAKSAAYLDSNDSDTSGWPAWKQSWLVFDSDAQEDEYRVDRMIPAYFKLFGIGSLLTALVIAIDMAREVSSGTATPARTTVSSLAIAVYVAVVLHTSFASVEKTAKAAKQGRFKYFLFRHALDIWLVTAMLLTCLPEYLKPAKPSSLSSTLGGYIPAFFILVIADYTGNGLLFPWNVVVALVAFILQLAFSMWASAGNPWHVYTHLSPILSAILIAWPSYYANDRLQRISYLNWNRLEQERTESVEAKSRLDNQLTLMFPQAILPALRADFESGNHGVIAKSIKSAAVIFVEFGGKQLKSHMLSTKVEEAAKAVKVLNCIFAEVDALLATPEFQQLHKIKTLGSKVLLAGGLFSSWSKGSGQSNATVAARRESLSPRVVPDLVRFLHTLYSKLYRMNVQIVDLLDIKAGMHIGPLVVGIVGNTRFYFDVYGDTINCSSRMMDLAKPGELAFGETVCNAVQAYVSDCRCLGMQQIKGKGLMEVYVSHIESGGQTALQGSVSKFSMLTDDEEEVGPVERMAMAVTFSMEDEPETPTSAVGMLLRRLSHASRLRAVSFGQRLCECLWSATKQFRRFFTFQMATWADSKAAYTAETIITMPADQYVGHLGSYLRRIPGTMTRKVLFGEMNGWLLHFRNADLEQIYRAAKAHDSHRSILLTCILGIIASAGQVFAALSYALGSPSASTQLAEVVSSGNLWTAHGHALVWLVVGAGLQLSSLFWIFAGIQAENPLASAISSSHPTDLARRPADWAPSAAPAHPGPTDEPVNNHCQNCLSLIRILVLVSASVGFTLLHISTLLLTNLDSNFGYSASLLQLCAFFTVTIPMAGGWIFGESQCALALGLVGGGLAWIAVWGGVDGYEGVQGVLMALVSVVTSLVNKQVEREDFLLRLVSAKHSLMTSFENERALKFLECLVPAHIVPNLLSVPRKDVVEKLEMETVMFMDICGFTKLSALMEPYAVIRMLNAIFYEFDQIIQATAGRMQKITTIGDAYLACTLTTPRTQSGSPSSTPASSAYLCVQTAIAFQQKLNLLHSYPWFTSMLRGHTVLIRIGIHTSDVIGTVLGSRYELVGKAVGVAEKVQEGCKPGGVAISSTTKALCPDFKCASNGKWVVSGESVAVVGKRPEERVDFVECFDLDVDLKDTKEG